MITKNAWRIYQVINESGEIRPYSPEMANQVQELRELMMSMTVMRAQLDLLQGGQGGRQSDGDDLARMLFACRGMS